MTVEVKYNFNEASDYTFDSALVEVVGGEARLKLANNTGQQFVEDFTDDTGFTYDNTKVEINGNGQAEQIKQTPNDSIWGANYSTVINANWSSAPLAPIATSGTPQITDNSLDLNTDSTSSVTYDLTNGFDPEKGAIKFKWKPTDTNGETIFTSGDVVGSNNNQLILIYTGTAFNLVVRNENGGTMLSSALGSFTPSLLDFQEVELNYDTRGTGEYRLFIDGVNYGGLKVNASQGTRASLGDTIQARIGATSGNASFYKDMIFFSEVQHTANYTPGYTVSNYVYDESPVILPTFVYSGQGNIQAYESGVETVPDGSPKWTVNGKWFDGGAWVISDNSYAQSNTMAEVNANIGSGQVSNSLIMALIFPNSITTQSIVSNLVINYTGQHYEAGSTIIPNAGVPVTAVIDFIETATKPVNTDIKYQMEVNASFYWFNGGSWQSASGIAQTNTAAEVLANLATLPISESGDFVRPKIFFTTDGSATSAIQTLCLEVNYDVNPVAKPGTTIIFGSLRDMIAEPMTGTATLRIVNDDQFFISGNSIQPGSQEKSANDEGVAAISGIIKTASIDYKYSFYIDYFDAKGKKQTKSLGKSVAPDDLASNIANLTFE